MWLKYTWAVIAETGFTSRPVRGKSVCFLAPALSFASRYSRLKFHIPVSGCCFYARLEQVQNIMLPWMTKRQWQRTNSVALQPLGTYLTSAVAVSPQCAATHRHTRLPSPVARCNFGLCVPATAVCLLLWLRRCWTSLTVLTVWLLLTPVAWNRETSLVKFASCLTDPGNG